MTFDWILPTNPVGAMVFGFLITVGFLITTWRDTKDVKMVGITFFSGIMTTVLATFLLNYFGYLG